MNTTTQTVPTLRYLLIIEDPTARRMITLDGAKYTLGRQSGNSIVLNSRKASRKHATLIKKNNAKNNQFSYWILDGGLNGQKSHNGIFINGEKCLVHELKDGDLINFGCEVNASYHIINSVAEADSENPLETLSILTKPEKNVHQKSTLILSDAHIDSDEQAEPPVDDDTFHDQAYLDSLTGLPNRSLFNEYLSIALANAKRNGNNLALLLIDIAQFNEINQTYGYVMGDQVLQKMGGSLNECVRASDIVARWTGNTFAILLPQLKDINNSEKIQKRILKKTNQPMQMDKFSLAVTTHTSLVIYPQDGSDITPLISTLEDRLEKEKQHSSPAIATENRPQPPLQPERFNRIGSRLQNALEREEFILCYQPQININTGSVEVMEALIRWQHPQQGLIYPRQFFPWLEHSDLLIPITQWILETACYQTRTWQELRISSLPVSINLSIHQFQHPDFLKLLANVLTKIGIDPHQLELEITEKTILKNLEKSRSILAELTELGVHLSLDNFGKGLVSIGYLQDFPFRKIKIEKSFIHHLTHYPDDTGMITALIALGKSFKLQVVAEGVETQQQLEILRNLHCEVMQGYRFSQPLKAEQAIQFLRLHT